MSTASSPKHGKILLYRHSFWVRLTHWIWVLSLTILFMSGLQIFNAHPSLNFGNTTTFDSKETGPNRLVLDTIETRVEGSLDGGSSCDGRVVVEKGARVTVSALADNGHTTVFEAVPRVDTPQEAEYFRNGGILPFVLRQLAAS